MLVWLVIVALLVFFWATLWSSYPRMAIGALVGIPLGWWSAGPVMEILRGDMHDIPLWLPPLPFAIVAILLLVVGGIIWFSADDK